MTSGFLLLLAKVWWEAWYEKWTRPCKEQQEFQKSCKVVEIHQQCDDYTRDIPTAHLGICQQCRCFTLRVFPDSDGCFCFPARLFNLGCICISFYLHIYLKLKLAFRIHADHWGHNDGLSLFAAAPVGWRGTMSIIWGVLSDGTGAVTFCANLWCACVILWLWSLPLKLIRFHSVLLKTIKLINKESNELK